MTSFHSEYTQWTIERIVKAISNNQINLNPPYQRNAVWSTNKKRALIESIIIGYPIPNITFSQRPQTENYRFNAVDGQQRCRSIFEFTDNRFAIKINGVEKKYSELAEAERIPFLYKSIPVATMHNMSLEDEAKYYERINRGVALSNGELIKSYMYSPFAEKRNQVFNPNSDVVTALSHLFQCPFPRMDKRYKYEANFTGFLAGLTHGVEYLTNTFPTLQVLLEQDEFTKQAELDRNLTDFINIWRDAIYEDHVVIPAFWKKASRMWNIGYLQGYIIYSLWDNTTTQEQRSRVWRKFILEASRNTDLMQKFEYSINIKSKNLNVQRYKRGWEKIREFFSTGEAALTPYVDDVTTTSDDSDDE